MKNLLRSAKRYDTLQSSLYKMESMIIMQTLQKFVICHEQMKKVGHALSRTSHATKNDSVVAADGKCLHGDDDWSEI